MLSFREILVNHRLNSHLSKEWLETNLMGGYASSSIVGCHTRKYHGLLVLPHEGDKLNLLSKFEAEILVGEQTYPLSTNSYPGTFYPDGYRHLDRFESKFTPIFYYSLEGGLIEVEVSLLMPRYQPTVLVKYHVVRSPEPLVLINRPLLTCRSFHELRREQSSFDMEPTSHPSCYELKVGEGIPSLYFSSDPPSDPLPVWDWYHNMQYLEEKARGFDFKEEVFCPLQYEHRLDEGQSCFLRSSLLPAAKKKIQVVWNDEVKKRETEWQGLKEPDRTLRHLKYNARHFQVSCPGPRRSVVAGYPWFGEWGRDAMIALPGLSLYSGKEKWAFEVLQYFGKHVKNGLIPNHIDSSGQNPAYNSIDASLWYFWACYQYIEVTGDLKGAIQNFYPVMKKIISAFLNGDVDIAELDVDGFVLCGHLGTQYTWMDARVEGVPVTPRAGFAVEINALWYNALCIFLDLSVRTKKNPPILADAHAMRERFKDEFVRRFWLEEVGYLADVVWDDVVDDRLRPNQVMAVSLPYPLLDREFAQKMLSIVKNELVTPFGLRTLGSDDPSYFGHYGGGVWARDKAYHQGTVWPWLCGAFGEALLKISPHPARDAKWLRETFQPLWQQHLGQYGVGFIAEVFDGDLPHLPGGCMAQAWSVAEVIRLSEMLRKAGV